LDEEKAKEVDEENQKLKEKANGIQDIIKEIESDYKEKIESLSKGIFDF
jgi:hypothetical protein